MEQVEAIKLFYEFLVENNALFNYLKYSNFEMIHGITMSDYILYMPIWKNTDEGHNYWNKLDNKWVEKLKQNNVYEHN